MNYMDLKSFYTGKRVLVTGHTGFKGTWMCAVLNKLGAEVVGYSLTPPTTPNLFDLVHMKDQMRSYIGDIRDLPTLMGVFEREQPEIVIHMAAQPLVRESYKDPVRTYDVNVMGTVNVLECCRNTKSLKSLVNVTTDKVYRNDEREYGFVETDELCGYDPYSNSKSCSELVTDSFRNSFFNELGIPISSIRAGNVIGGGDFASDRIIPDCVRAIQNGETIKVRNPYSVRPYQHVLEPLIAYLTVAKAQYVDRTLASCYNLGPNDCDCVSTGKLVTLLCERWRKNTGNEIKWVNCFDGGPHEAGYLRLDSNKIKKVIGWQSKWDISMSIDKIVEWTTTFIEGGDILECMNAQIEEYLRN